MTQNRVLMNRLNLLKRHQEGVKIAKIEIPQVDPWILLWKKSSLRLISIMVRIWAIISKNTKIIKELAGSIKTIYFQKSKPTAKETYMSTHSTLTLPMTKRTKIPASKSKIAQIKLLRRNARLLSLMKMESWFLGALIFKKMKCSNVRLTKITSRRKKITHYAHLNANNFLNLNLNLNLYVNRNLTRHHEKESLETKTQKPVAQSRKRAARRKIKI